MDSQPRKHGYVGRIVIRNGIIDGFHHYVQAIKLEEKLSEHEALEEAVKLLDDLKILFKEDIAEIKGDTNEKTT